MTNLSGHWHVFVRPDRPKRMWHVISSHEACERWPDGYIKYRDPGMKCPATIRYCDAQWFLKHAVREPSDRIPEHAPQPINRSVYFLIGQNARKARREDEYWRDAC